MLARVFKLYLPEQYPYDVVGGQRVIKKTDFDDRIDIIPVSEPNIFSMAQRVMLAQQELEMARAAPEIHDLREAYRRMYEALEVKNIDALLQPPAEVPARDPITEQQAALTGQPIQAYVFQNHDAYIASHTAFLQNPMVQQNQNATVAIQANIQEHQAMKYRQQIEQALGQPLPQMGEGEMPPEVMNQIASAAAQATQQVTGQEQALIQAQQNAQVEPLVQLKQAEIQQRAQSDQMRAEVDLLKQQSNEAIAEMKIAQQREQALIKEKEGMRKDYRDILKDVRDSDNRTKDI